MKCTITTKDVVSACNGAVNEARVIFEGNSEIMTAITQVVAEIKCSLADSACKNIDEHYEELL